MAERQVFIDRVKGAERECYVVAAAVTYGRSSRQRQTAEYAHKDVAPRPRHGVRNG
jgi:hypothetical protein